MTWMIYGATGYTGGLVAEEAVRRGHKPLLAGRSPQRLEPLADQLGLDWIAVPLDDSDALCRAVAQVDLVYHAAGPFIHTAAPMQRACLDADTHYLDITGELDVFEQTYRYDAAARDRGIALISGAGFDVVPSDCLAKYVADHVRGATQLEIAIAALSRTSAGTTKTMLEMLPHGVKVRRAGKLIRHPFGEGAKQVSFSNGEHTVLPIPWGDLATAYRSTGIPNITTYMAFPESNVRLLRMIAPLMQRALSSYAVRRVLQMVIERTVQGPDVALRRSARSYLWARAANEQGNSFEAWLETVEAYQFTVLAGVRAVETVLRDHPVGALTPAQAFGADWVLGVEGTRRLDHKRNLK